MRLTRILAILALPLSVGCLPKPYTPDVPNPASLPKSEATAEGLVKYLNEQAAKARSVEAKLAMDATSNGRGAGLTGFLACEKPRGFRLRGQMLGTEAVDLGSNSEEFWFWINKADPPYQYHCAYRDLATGKVAIPFPFQPDMILVALGMAEYDPAGKYDLVDNRAKGTLDLTLDTTAPDGQAVKRTVLFKRTREVRAGHPQVVGHVLRDGKGAVICTAKVTAVHADAASGAAVPSVVELAWPEQKASMKLMLTAVKVNKLEKGRAADLFARRPIPGVRSFDMARRRVDADPTARASRR